jgi:hypothetical protein
LFTFPILFKQRLDSSGQRHFRFNEFRSVDATTRALDKRQSESTEEREAQACIKRPSYPAHYLSLLSSGFLGVEFGDSRYDEHVTDCGNPSQESDLPQPSYRVPVPRNPGCKYRPDLDESFPPGRILFEPEELCRPPWLPMVSDNLMFIFKSFPETVPVSNLPNSSCGTGVASLFKSG